MDHECKQEGLISALYDDVKEIKRDIKVIIKTMSVLTVKSSVWGIIGGAVVVALWYFKEG